MKRMGAPLLAAVVIIGATWAVPALASTAGSRPMTLAGTVTPNTGLIDNQVVDVGWSGFPKGTPVYIRMCAQSATSTSQCAVPAGDLDHYTTGSNGTGIVRYLLVAKSFGSFQCDDTDPCSIAILQDPADLGSGAIVQIAFASPPGTCPDATVQAVAGEGASPAAFTMYDWESNACQLSSHLNVTYTNDNSFDGIEHFLQSNPNSNFAVSGFGMSAHQVDGLHAKHRGFAYAPLTATAVSLGFNIQDQSGHQITHLVLTPKVVAEIATGSLSTFDCPAHVSDEDCVNFLGGDPAIRELNPGIKFPDGPIHFFIRAEHAASTLAFTSWMAATAPGVWTYGAVSGWPPGDPNKCITCPPGIQGEGLAALAVGFPASYTNTDVYIGVMDSTYAPINDLPVTALVNPGAPNAGVLPSAASVDAALADATKNDDGTLTPNYGTTDPDAYPIPMQTYAIVPTTQGWPHFTADDGKTLSSFLTYAATDGQGVLPPGSYPLTSDLAQAAKDAAKKIPTTEPTHHGDGGGGGDGNGDGGGLGNGPGTTPAPTPASPTPTTTASPTPASPSPPFSAAGAQLTSPASSAIVPTLAAIALLGILIGPTVLLISRARPAVAAATARRLVGKMRPPRRAPKPPPSSEGP